MRSCRVVAIRKRYTDLAERRRGDASLLERGDRNYSNARVVVFLLGAGLLVVALVTQRPIWLLPTALAATAFVALVVGHERLAQRQAVANRRIAFYERGLRRLDDRWHDDGCIDRHFVPADHVYADDLDLFGPHSLFQRLCAARSRRGRERLATWLCAPASFDVVAARQRAIDELRPRCELREALDAAGPDLDEVDVEGVVTWGQRPTPAILNARWLRPAGVVLPIVLLAIATAAWLGTAPTWPAVIVLGLEGWVMSRLRHVLAATRAQLERRQPAIEALGRMLACLERETMREPLLIELSQRMRVEGLPPSRQIAKLRRRIAWFEAYYGGWFAVLAFPVMWPVHCILALESWRRTAGPALDVWLDALADFEALLSLAAYADENPDDPFPTLEPTSPCFVAKALGHPLLGRDACVRNDIYLDSERQALLVSGSNMSGKSTFLRSVGINAVLAQAGAPVRAASLTLSPLQVGATVRIEDSLQAGRSRFYAEIVRLKTIVDLAARPGGRHLLFLLDEVFHGTNSRDRRISASALLRLLVDRAALGLVTTHDLELTKVADELAPRIRNVHFCDELHGDRLHFDYTLRPGVVQRSNARALMRAVGLALGDDPTDAASVSPSVLMSTQS